MHVNIYPLIRSLASYILPVSVFNRPGSGGTFSSKYCYSVWLRHLHYLKKNELISDVGELQNIAEIGPGDSLGIGLAALYCGVKNYYAFDVIEHANLDVNLQINIDLNILFQEKTNIPHGPGFEATNPKLEIYDFPIDILPFTNKEYAKRQKEIERALKKDVNTALSINYIVPWNSGDHNEISNLDLIFSQAVREHVAYVKFAYKEMYKWLRKGGILSHQVDFKAHEMTKEWDGHWYIGESLWQFLAHGRKYPMNRLPLSAHLNLLKEAGFKITNIVPVKKESNFSGKKMKLNGIEFTREDLVTSSALIQAKKI